MKRKSRGHQRPRSALGEAAAEHLQSVYRSVSIEPES